MTFEDWLSAHREKTKGWPPHEIRIKDWLREAWEASRKQTLEDAAQTCDTNAVAYGAMGATRMKEAARACAVVIRRHAEPPVPHTSGAREGGGE